MALFASQAPYPSGRHYVFAAARDVCRKIISFRADFALTNSKMFSATNLVPSNIDLGTVTSWDVALSRARRPDLLVARQFLTSGAKQLKC